MGSCQFYNARDAQPPDTGNVVGHQMHVGKRVPPYLAERIVPSTLADAALLLFDPTGNKYCANTDPPWPGPCSVDTNRVNVTDSFSLRISWTCPERSRRALFRLVVDRLFVPVDETFFIITSSSAPSPMLAASLASVSSIFSQGWASMSPVLIRSDGSTTSIRFTKSLASSDIWFQSSPSMRYWPLAVLSKTYRRYVHS